MKGQPPIRYSARSEIIISQTDRDFILSHHSGPTTIPTTMSLQVARQFPPAYILESTCCHTIEQVAVRRVVLLVQRNESNPAIVESKLSIAESRIFSSHPLYWLDNQTHIQSALFQEKTILSKLNNT